MIGNDLQPVEEILAKAPLLHLDGEVAVAGGDHADVGLDGAVRTDRPDLALLQDAQQLHLERRAHLADLVEEDRAAVGELEHAPCARRPRR